MYPAYELLDAIGDTLEDGLYALDAEGVLEYLNPAAETALGWPSDEATGRDAHELFHHLTGTGEHLSAVDCPLGEVLLGHAYVGAITFVTRSGVLLPVICASSPIRRDGAVVGAALAFRHVAEGATGRVSSTAMAGLGFLGDTSFDAVFAMDSEGTIKRWNRAAETLFGYPRSEVIGSSATAILSPRSERSDHEASLKQFMATVGPHLSRPFDARAIHQDGDVIPVELSIAATVDSGVRCIIAFVRDIRQRERARMLTDTQHQFLRILNEAATFDGGAYEVLRAIGEMLECPVAQMWRIEGGRPYIWQSWHLPTPELAAFEEASRVFSRTSTEGLITQAVTTGTPVWTDDLATYPPFLRGDAATAGSLTSGIVIPLSVGDVVVGALECYSSRMPDPDAAMIDALTNIGVHLGQFISRAEQTSSLERTSEDRRTLLRQLIVAQEEERRRIALDLHDDAVQVMAAVSIRLSLMSDRTTDPADQLAVAKLRDTVAASIDRLRAVLFELNPPSLTQHGFVAALRMRLAELCKETDCTYSLRGSFANGPDDETSILMYRIAQEICTNVRKHAHATSLVVDLADRDNGYEVTIADDGQGFLPEDARPVAGHLGLASLRERAGFAGGTVSIESAIGKGTTVRFWIPVGLGEPAVGTLVASAGVTS